MFLSSDMADEWKATIKQEQQRTGRDDSNEMIRDRVGWERVEKFAKWLRYDMNPLSGHHLAVYHDIRKVHLIFMTIVAAFIHSFQLMHQREGLYGWLLIKAKRKRILRVDNFYGGWQGLPSCCWWWRWRWRWGLLLMALWSWGGCCDESNLRTRWYPKANLKPTWALMRALFVSSCLGSPSHKDEQDGIKWLGFSSASLSFVKLSLILLLPVVN